MSRKVKEWLFRLMIETTHKERERIDREIERRKAVNCDEAIEKGNMSEEEFLQIVNMVKERKERKIEIAYAV